MAKGEAHRVPGLGQLMRSFGAFSVRRGESDRGQLRAYEHRTDDDAEEVGGVVGEPRGAVGDTTARTAAGETTLWYNISASARAAASMPATR